MTRSWAVCPDCGHYETAHTTGGNCDGGPPSVSCNCIRMRPIEMEPPTEQLAKRIEVLERAAEPRDIEREALLVLGGILALRRTRGRLSKVTVDDIHSLLVGAAILTGKAET